MKIVELYDDRNRKSSNVNTPDPDLMNAYHKVNQKYAPLFKKLAEEWQNT